MCLKCRESKPATKEPAFLKTSGQTRIIRRLQMAGDCSIPSTCFMTAPMHSTAKPTVR